MKKYRFIGTEDEAKHYTENLPERHKIYNENDIIGNYAVSWWVDCQRSWHVKEWEEVMDYEEEVKEILDTVKDNINPDHYKQGKVEVIDMIESATIGISGFEGFCVGNIIKYVSRYNQKNGIEDVRKSKWYLERLIKYLEDESTSV
jgi:hypothetical protein